MREDSSILEAAKRALELIGEPSDIKKIHKIILQHGLYQFNTPVPEHVLDTTLKRHLADSPRKDQADPILFKMTEDSKYKLAGDAPQVYSLQKNQGTKRIMRDSNKEDLIQELMSEKIGVFKEIWRLLLFAAQIGVREGRKEPLESIEKGKGIDQSTFGNSSSWPGILYLMSLVEANDASLLSGDDEGERKRTQLFEQYANGGLAILKEHFEEHAASIDALLEFIDAHSFEPSKNNISEIDLSI